MTHSRTDLTELEAKLRSLLASIDERAPYVEATLAPAIETHDPGEWFTCHRGRARSSLRWVTQLNERAAELNAQINDAEAPGILSRSDMRDALDYARGLSGPESAAWEFLRGFIDGDPKCRAAVRSRPVSYDAEDPDGPCP
jgi:hypothetical protein